MAKSPGKQTASLTPREARDRALQTTPSAVLDAFTTTGGYVGALVIRPLTLGTQMVFERIKHPFTDPQFKGNLKEVGDLQIARAIFVMSHAAVESMELLDRGEAEFDRAVIEQMDQIPFADQLAVGQKLMAAIQQSVRTLIGGSGGNAGNGKAGADPLAGSPAKTPGPVGNSH